MKTMTLLLKPVYCTIFVLMFSAETEAQVEVEDFVDVLTIEPKVESSADNHSPNKTRSLKLTTTTSIAEKTETRNYITRGKVLFVEAVEADGDTSVFPAVNIPVQFRHSSPELLDSQSKSNIGKLAEAIKQTSSKSPQFVIEGHSAIGKGSYLAGDLSLHRARMVYFLLVHDHEVDPALLTVRGLGVEFAKHPEGSPESLLQEDRRVTIVREK